MKPDSWMPYYGADFEADTKPFIREAKWSYLAAIWHYWSVTKTAGLPNEDRDLMQICDCPAQEWGRTKPRIFCGKPYFYLEKGKWHQERARQLYEEAQLSYQKRIAASKVAVASRKQRTNESSNESSNESLNNPFTKPQPQPYIKKVPANAGEHGAFIEGWCQNYKATFGVDYKVCGGRDGKAVKELLSMGIARLDLLEIAKSAWGIASFNCGQAKTIHGFRQYFNPIHVEVKNGIKAQPPKPKPESIVEADHRRMLERIREGRI